MLHWLYSIELIDPIGTDTLRVALGQLVYLTGNCDYTNRRLKELGNTKPYLEDCDLLCSVPGIGRHTAIKFMIEIGDIGRFKTLDKLCNYIGLVPASDSSGDKVKENRMTYRGNKELRTMLIESAWTSIGIDPALALCYQNLKKRMIGQKAIVRIARKLLSRMRHVLLTREKYEHGIA